MREAGREEVEGRGRALFPLLHSHLQALRLGILDKGEQGELGIGAVVQNEGQAGQGTERGAGTGV